MKITYIVILFSTVFLQVSNAQESFHTFYENHKKNYEVTNFKMPAWLFKWQASVEDEQSKEVIKKVKKAYFLISENQNQNLLKALNNYLVYPTYKEVVIIHEEGSKVTIKTKDALSVIEEIVLIIEEEKELVVICMSGSFQKDELYTFVKAANSSSIDF